MRIKYYPSDLSDDNDFKFRYNLQAILLTGMQVGSQTVILNLARLLPHLYFHKELGKSQE